jgi:hypothetical protein
MLMRRLLLLAVLTSACDQGATAAPKPALQQQDMIVNVAQPPKYEPYVIRDTADFMTKASVLLEELLHIFELANQDCDALVSRIEKFSEEHVTRFSVLTAYSKAHPETEKQLQEKFQPYTERLMKVMTPALTKCMQGESGTRMTKAFEKLAQNTQLQRPR